MTTIMSQYRHHFRNINPVIRFVVTASTHPIP